MKSLQVTVVVIAVSLFASACSVDECASASYGICNFEVIGNSPNDSDGNSVIDSSTGTADFRLKWSTKYTSNYTVYLETETDSFTIYGARNCVDPICVGSKDNDVLCTLTGLTVTCEDNSIFLPDSVTLTGTSLPAQVDFVLRSCEGDLAPECDYLPRSVLIK